MKHTKRAMSCGIVAVAMAIMFAGASLSGNVTDTSQSSQQANTNVVVLADNQAAAPAKETKEIVQVNDESEPKTTPVVTADPEWVGKAMADVKEALNVRAEASADADLVGKLYAGSLATVVEEGTEWTKIQSGNVSGYVMTKYLVFGDDAKALAAKSCKMYVESKVGGLAVRSTTDENAENKIHVLEEGEKIEVNATAESVDGWVVVTYKGKTGYVSAQYVSEPTYEFAKALTVAEEQAAEKAKTKSKAKSSDKSSTKTSTKSTSKSSDSSKSTGSSKSTSASYSDAQILAALIWCEARGESYEGQVAVGAVVMNRVQSGSFPGSISGVVYQGGQFSPVSSGKLKKALANGNYCMDAAQAALAGQDPTGGALYFNSGSGKGLQIGNQHFW